MMKMLLLTIVCFALALSGLIADEKSTSTAEVVYHPVNHASLVLQYDDKTIFVDPVGKEELWSGLPAPDLILVTHQHHDHYNKAILDRFVSKATQLIVNPAVAKLYGSGRILKNGESALVDKIKIEAIPAYNTTTERLQFHPKGRDNGYVLTLGATRLYLSGDTEDIPAMRALKDIDIAFICMNLPYTMSPEQAASAVLDFKPKTVIPYHYRGKVPTDLSLFRKLVRRNPNIQVIDDLKWY